MMIHFFLSGFLLILRSINAKETFLKTSQFNVLYDLYQSTNGPYWDYSEPFDAINGYPWNFSSLLNNPCDLSKPWQGITCSKNSKGEYFVTEIELNDMSLMGTLPSSISNLWTLEQLSIVENEQLSGSIPSGIGSLTSLNYLAIGFNSMTGTIPNELSYCDKLKYLYIAETNIVGSIPEELNTLKDLEILDLHSNKLIGTIPKRFDQLSSLKELNLQSNQLTGSIPTELRKLRFLISLQLSSNLFSGNIPSLRENI